VSNENLPATSSEALAAAICYLLAADPTMLDPDGELGADLWPLDVSDYEPSSEPTLNIEKAVGLISTAVEFLQIEEENK
jgi:hypothetical protein